MPRLPLRPRSVPRLLLSGFALVALPLMLAVVLALTYVDRLSDQGERLVVQGVQVTRLSNRLTGIVIAMERNMRQYAVLGDPELAMAVSEHHRDFQDTMDALAGLDLETATNLNLADLRSRAQTIADAAATSPAAAQTLLQRQPDTFSRLRGRTEAITEQGNKFIDKEVSRLQALSDEARRFLLLCVFAVLPVAALLVIFFTVVISRPVRQIQRAMRQLGEGDFSQPVTISAPSSELDVLSDQLDWMRRRLEALESEKNQFLRHMSHELKTPLASIREGVELLRDQSLGKLTPKQAEVVDILHGSSLELLNLIENLLNFAAWQQHRSQLTRTHFDLNELLDQILERHRLAMENKRLRVHGPEKTIILNADRDQIRLILDNLVANAVKFSPQEGGLYLNALEQKRDWVIEIADDGPGIPANEREAVFNPFYQSNQPERAHVKGTGIGLSVVREAVRAHGGEVHVTTGLGQGACFRITLPRGEDDE